MENVIGLITTNYSVKNPSVLTQPRPVAALPVAGRYRMLDFAMSNMVNAGIRNVGLILPYNYRAIMDHVESGKDWFLDRKHGGLFLLPGCALGSSRSGARFLIRDLLENRVFVDRAKYPLVIISSAGFMYNMDYQKLVEDHKASGADITCVVKTAEENNKSIMSFEVEGGKVTAVNPETKYGDKEFIDCFIASVDVLKELMKWYLAQDHIDLFEALSNDLDRVNIRTYEFEGSALPVLSARDFYKNSMKLLDPRIGDEIFNDARPIYTKSHDNPPAKYEPGANVSCTMVSGGSRIAGNVERSILSRNVIVEAGAFVKNSIIMQSCIIKSGAHVENAVIDRNNIIASGTELRGTSDDILIKGKRDD